MTRFGPRASVLVLVALLWGCGQVPEDGAARASGYVEATEITLAAKVGGRVSTVTVTEGARIEAGAVVATIATDDIDLAMNRVRAERAHADAALRLVTAGARQEDLAQARAQVAAAVAEFDAASSDLAAARADEGRFEQLLQNRAGSVKQRDDAVARRQQVEARVKGAADRVEAARAGLARLEAGARPEEVAAARARVAAVDAQIAAMEHDKSETVIRAPAAGVVTSRLVEPGELVAVGSPVTVFIDLDNAWVNAYVEEPLVPQLKVGGGATIVTDAGDRLNGRIAFIAPRAEFTPRNVQTANERAKLVYRVKVSTDNSGGVLKPGMPVEVELTGAQ